jgi:hypothetical protein
MKQTGRRSENEKGMKNSELNRLDWASKEDQPVRRHRMVATAEAITAALLAVIVAATVAWQWRHSFAMPIYDDLFDRLRFYRAITSTRDLLTYLISTHNEHRIATTRLIAIADELFFSGREHTQVIATNIFQFASAYAVYRVFIADLGRDAELSRRLFIGFSTLLLFINPNFFYTLVVPFQVQHAIMALLVIIASSVMSRATTFGMPVSGQIHLVSRLVAIAVVATFTLGNAPAILISATATAVILRCRLTLVVALVVLAFAHTVIILTTTGGVGAKTLDVLKIGYFALIYWGAPFLRLDPWPSNYATWGWSDHLGIYLSAGFGAVVLLTTVAFGSIRLFKPGLGGRVAIFGFMILVAVVVTGLAAAYSRAEFGILEGANKKYASFAALGWVGVLAIFTGIVREQLTGAWSDTPVFASFLAIVLPLSTLGYMRETRIWQKEIDRTWEGGLAVFLHINDPTYLHDIYTDESELRKYIVYVEPRKRGIFSYFPFRWGDEAKIVLATRRPMGCRGVVERVDPIPAQDLTHIFQSPGTPEVISGWAWMDKNHEPPETIIAVDARDRIVGLARTTRASASAEEWLGQKMNQNVGWFGFARPIEPSPLTFFGLSADGKGFCALGSLGSVR